MRLYYTGASKHLGIQGSPITSLGGHVSSTLVPSGVEGSVLTEISQPDLVNKRIQCVLLALKNVTESSATLKLYYDLPDSDLYDLEVGLVVPAMNNCSEPYFEQISNPSSLPIGVTFAKPIGEDSALTHILASNAYLGVWIKRTIKPEAESMFLSCDSLYQAFLDPASPHGKQKFSFDLHIKW